MSEKQNVFTAAEFAAFNMGYKAAMGVLKDHLVRWSQAEEVHATCSCSHCIALREIGRMKYLSPYEISTSE
jgi:hypothetical protein